MSDSILAPRRSRSRGGEIDPCLLRATPGGVPESKRGTRSFPVKRHLLTKLAAEGNSRGTRGGAHEYPRSPMSRQAVNGKTTKKTQIQVSSKKAPRSWASRVVGSPRPDFGKWPCDQDRRTNGPRCGNCGPCPRFFSRIKDCCRPAIASTLPSGSRGISGARFPKKILAVMAPARYPAGIVAIIKPALQGITEVAHTRVLYHESRVFRATPLRSTCGTGTRLCQKKAEKIAWSSSGRSNSFAAQLLWRGACRARIVVCFPARRLLGIEDSAVRPPGRSVSIGSRKC
jgi:hypothetical protein